MKLSPMAKIHISRRSFYRVKKKYFWPIELVDKDPGTGSVLIHVSVKQRWDQDSKYRPENLVDIWDHEFQGLNPIT